MANLTNSAKLIEEVEKKVNSSSLATVATSWSYADLSNKPTIPTVNDSTITVQKNGANVGSFTTNAAAWKTINIQLAKADVWLGNVDNTSDANKPISTATQTALNNKQNKLTPGTGITINASNEISTTALPGTTKYGASLDLSIDDTTFVITAQLKDQDGNNLWTPKTIDLPLESVVVSWSYDSATKKVILTLKDWSTVDFSVADLISWLQSEITSTNKLNADLVDDTNSAHKFVSATEKSTWNGKQAALTTAQLNAANSWITSAKVSTYDWYATSKQDKLTTQTAYSQKGSATKVPQITTNTLGQVTWITEVDIEAGETYNAGDGISIGDVCISTNDMQWPCPDGYHVPSHDEWKWVQTIMNWLSLTTTDSWRVNLHIPLAGSRDSNDAHIRDVGSSTLLWSSTAIDGFSWNLNMDTDKASANGLYGNSSCLSVRWFKNSFEEPTSSRTVIQWTLWWAWIFRNQTEWLISITSDWTTWYTIQDKNLWATQVYNDWDTLSEANCGKYYQWWNNYWFPWTWSVTTSSTQVNASSYWPWNYYSSSTFITGNADWSSVTNNNLRWWVSKWSSQVCTDNVITNTWVLSVNGQTGNVTIASPDMSNYLAKDNTTVFTPTWDYNPATKKYVDDNAGTEYHAWEWISIGEWQVTARKWPSPDWFHVPSSAEWQWVKTIMNWLSLTTWDWWRINLHIPFAGNRSYPSADLGGQGSDGNYWSSSPYGSDYPNDASNLYLNSSYVFANDSSSRAFGFSVRCFKDTYVAPTSSWTVIQWTLGNAWIFWNQSEWLISITNWTTGYTMMDKNLWATTVYNDWDTLTQSNMWNMYQWWNNYWFPSTGSVTKSSTKVDASWYGPDNYYSNNIFIAWNEDWSSVSNNDLRWDTTWTVAQDNVITNTWVLSVNWQTWNVTVASPDMSNYLAKDNATAFTPTWDYQPATKKYVDDNAGAGSEQNLFIITEDMVTVTTSEDKWVAPYNTSYRYTNINIDANAGIKWKEWAIYTFVVDTKMVVASTYRNVRVKIWDWAYIPVMATTAAVSGHSYFIKTAIRQFQYTTKYESWWALHVFTDSNTTYKLMTEAQATAWTEATALTISPSILKWAITTHAPVKSVNWATWAVTVQPTISDLSTIRTNAANWATVVSWDSWKNYVIKVSTSAPASWTANNVITIVTN